MKIRGWTAPDGIHFDLWVTNIKAWQTKDKDVIEHQGVVLGALGDCKFYGNPKGYLNGHRTEFNLPPYTVVKRIHE